MNTMKNSGTVEDVSRGTANVEETLKQCVDQATKIQFVLQTMCTAHSLKTFEYSVLQSMAIVLRDTANELYENASQVKEAYGTI